MSVGYASGIFPHINKYIYNHTFCFLPSPNNYHNDFILIDASGRTSDDLVKLIDIINSQNPKLLIADIFHHTNFNEKTLNHMINSHSNILFSLPVFISDTGNIKYFDSYKSHLGVFAKHNQLAGLYNLKNLYDQTFYKVIPFFEYHSLVSLISDISIEKMSGYKYYTNYNGNPPFAKIYAKNILEKNIIPELMQDKIILLSNFDNSYVTSSHSLQFGENFLHQGHLAFLIKSAVYNNWLHSFSIWQYFLFLTISTFFWIILFFFFFYRYINFTFIFILSIIIPFSAYWIAVAYGSFLLPISEMTLILFSTIFLLLGHWKDLRTEEESKFLSRISKRLQDKVVHQTFFNSEEYGTELIRLASQFFPFKKTIFFEKLEGGTLINEVASMNCTSSEINEICRYYTRGSYAPAIQNKTVSIPKKPFFHEIGDNEKEFIVPLLHQNEVIGFLAFSIDTSEVEKIKNFTQVINNFAKEIGELLFNRTQFLKQKKNPKNLLLMLRLGIKNKNYHIIRSKFAIIEKRMLLNEAIFDSINSNIIAYDLFGEVIQINQQMHSLLESEKISAYTLSASDMLFHMTNIKEVEATELIRNVIITHKQHTQFIYCRYSQKKYLLTVQPITEDDVENKFTNNSLFQTYGLIFAFIDFSFIEKIYNLKQDVINMTLQRDKVRLDDLEQTIELLIKGKLTQKHQETMVSELKQQIHNMAFSRNQLDMLMRQSLDNNQDDQYPLSIMKSIDQSCNYIMEQYREKQINFDISTPASLPLVLVSVNSINNHLRTLFAFLAEDSEENGVITIDIQVNGKLMDIMMHSNGYGMPNEQLMSYLMHTQSVPDNYTALIETYKALKQWTGDIHFSSDLGKGVTISMSLKVVSL